MDDEENRWNGKMAEMQRRKDAIFFFQEKSKYTGRTK